MGELEPGQALPQGVVTHEWGFLPWPRDSRCLLLQGIASLIETNYETPCKTNVSDKHVKTSVPQTSVNTVTSVLQSLHSGIRIELIN